MGDHPCPRCYVSKDKLDQMGTIEDMEFRLEHQRVFTQAIEQSIAQARAALYGGATFSSIRVDKALKGKSLVPTVVSISFLRSARSLHFRRMPSPIDFNHWDWITIRCLPSISCMNLSLESGARSSNIPFESYLPKERMLCVSLTKGKNSVGPLIFTNFRTGYVSLRHLELTQFAGCEGTYQSSRNLQHAIMRTYYRSDSSATY
jgi:hypothetical protein